MIIRMTFCDNDFTGYLEDFCIRLRDKMFNPIYEIPERENYSSVDEYIAAVYATSRNKRDAAEIRERLMCPDNKFSTSSEEYKQICNEVLRLWKEFAKTCDMEGWVPYVSIQYKLKEKWENGEVVYYWTPYDKFITQ